MKFLKDETDQQAERLLTKEEAQARIDKIFRNAILIGLGLAVLGGLWMNSVLTRFSGTAEELQLEMTLLFIALIMVIIIAVSFAAFLAIYRVRNALNLAVKEKELRYMKECVEKAEKALDEAKNASQKAAAEAEDGTVH